MAELPSKKDLVNLREELREADLTITEEMNAEGLHAKLIKSEKLLTNMLELNISSHSRMFAEVVETGDEARLALAEVIGEQSMQYIRLANILALTVERFGSSLFKS